MVQDHAADKEKRVILCLYNCIIKNLISWLSLSEKTERFNMVDIYLAGEVLTRRGERRNLVVKIKLHSETWSLR